MFCGWETVLWMGGWPVVACFSCMRHLGMYHHCIVLSCSGEIGSEITVVLVDLIYDTYFVVGYFLLTLPANSELNSWILDLIFLL